MLLLQCSLERSRSDKILGTTNLSRLEHSPSTLDIPHRENMDHKSPGLLYSQVCLIVVLVSVAVVWH